MKYNEAKGPISQSDVEKYACIFLSDDFYVEGRKTDLSKIPCLPSFLLTSAEMILQSYIEYCSKYLKLLKKGNISISNHVMLVSGKFLSFDEKCIRNYMWLELFLQSLSTVITYILRHYQQTSKPNKVRICFDCVDKHIRTLASTEDQNQETFCLENFICDEDSKTALKNFAQYLQNNDNAKVNLTEMSFLSLLTWKKHSIVEKSGKKVEIINVEVWKIHYWIWVHQICKICSNVETPQLNESTRRVKIAELLVGAIYVPFLQLPCFRCTNDVVNGFIDDSFFHDVLALVHSKKEKLLSEYGRYMHSQVTSRIKLLNPEHNGKFDDNRFTADDFEQEVLPFLLPNPLRLFVSAYKHR